MDIHSIAFCITTFKRPKLLERLIVSIKKFYPQAHIYVADDSENGNVPFDSGLSFKRNWLIKHTTEPFLLFLDDDFIFTKQTVIEHFFDYFTPEIGIVGGSLFENGLRDYRGVFTLENNELTVKHTDEGNVQLTYNFFIARREIFECVRWDNDLKLAEHTDFFLRLSYTRWRVFSTSEVVIAHAPLKQGEYKKFRARGKLYTKLFMSKRGIQKITTPQGITVW